MKGGFNDPKMLIVFFTLCYCCIILSVGAYYYLNEEEEVKEENNNECKKGEIMYNGSCKKVKTIKDCIKENKGKLFKPNKKTKNTSCIQMSIFDAERYCLKNGLMYSDIDKKCITRIDDRYCLKICEKDKNCDTNFPLKADSTNTFCEEMSLRDVKKKCKELNRIYFNGKCLEKLTPPSLNINNN